MGMNDLILIGTGFAVARILYVWYAAPALARERSVQAHPVPLRITRRLDDEHRRKPRRSRPRRKRQRHRHDVSPERIRDP